MRTDGGYNSDENIFTDSCYIFKPEVFHGKKYIIVTNFFFDKQTPFRLLFWGVGVFVCWNFLTYQKTRIEIHFLTRNVQRKWRVSLFPTKHSSFSFFLSSPVLNWYIVMWYQRKLLYRLLKVPCNEHCISTKGHPICPSLLIFPVTRQAIKNASFHSLFVVIVIITLSPISFAVTCYFCLPNPKLCS